MGSVVLAVFSYAYSEREASEAERKQKAARAEMRKGQMSDYWQTYQKWQQEAKESYTQKLTTTKARMAASGVKTDTAQWQQNIANIEREYREQLKGYEEGATGTAMREYAEEMQSQQKFDESGEPLPMGEVTKLGMSEYFTKEFGTLELEKPKTLKQTSEETARRGAAGLEMKDTKKQQATTASPWW